MPSVISLFDKQEQKQEEKQDALVQSKLKPSERDRLDAMVEELRSRGHTEATRSSVIRAVVLDSLATFEEVLNEGQ